MDNIITFYIIMSFSKHTKKILRISIIVLFSVFSLQAQHQEPVAIDVYPGLLNVSNPNSSNPSELTAIGNKLIFNAISSGIGLGKEPHISDGTIAGTKLVDIRPGSDGSNARYFTEFKTGGSTFVYFFADDDKNGSDALWRINMADGTKEFVVNVNPIGNGDETSGSGGGMFLTNVKGTLYFSGQSPHARQELFKSDGTAAGTVLVKDINTNPIAGETKPSNPQNLTNVNGKLFFTADNGGTQENRELWISDGTDAGTMMVKDINPTGSSNPSNLVEKDGYCYFLADDGTGVALWRSDGTNTPNGTKKIVLPVGTTIDVAAGLVNSNNTIYFAATDATRGTELWTSSDDVNAQPIDLRSGPESSFPHNFTDVNGTCYFAANDGIHGNELWRSNSTRPGTKMVKNIQPKQLPSSPGNLTAVRGLVNGRTTYLLYFTATTSTNGRELWKSDGTETGTVLVKDINPSKVTSASKITGLTAVKISDDKDALFFAADDGGKTIGLELWYAKPCPTATLTYNSPTICKNAGCVSPKLTGSDGEDVKGGKYSVIPEGLPVDSSSGEICPNPSVPVGAYTITYKKNKGTGGSQCNIVASVVINVVNGGSSPIEKVNTLANGFSFNVDRNDPTKGNEEISDGVAGIVVSPNGQYLYVADEKNNNIKKIEISTKTVSLVAGGDKNNAGLADGNGATARFNFPSGLAIDASGTLYVADKDNHAIRKITDPGGVATVTTIAGNGTPGDVIGAIAGARFREPSDIVIDFSNNLYVADKNNHKIKKIDLNTNIVSILAGPAVGTDFPIDAIDGAASIARFNNPTGIALDLSGNLYVADRHNNLIRKVLISDGTTSTFAGDINNTNRGYVDGAAKDARFQFPVGVTVDLKGNVYVADTRNQVIRKISGGQVSTITGIGETPGFEDNTLAGSAKYNFPGGILVDLEQNIYISDKVNQSIRRYYIDNPNGIVTLGQQVCAGLSGTLTLSGHGTGIVTKWQSSPDGENWTDINKTTTTLNYTSLSGHTFYRAFVRNGACAPEPSNYAAIVAAGPTAPTAGDQARCGAGVATLVASGTSDGNYRWYAKIDNPTTAYLATGSSYTTGNLPIGEHTFYVAIAGATCESARVPVKVTISPNPTPSITGDNSACPGKRKTYTTTNNANNTYKWEVTNGTIASGQGTASIAVDWGPTPTTGTVKVTETTAAPASCAVTTSDYNVTITPVSTNPKVTHGSNCGPGTVSLSASGATGTMKYRWYAADTGGTPLKESTNAADNSYTTQTITNTTDYYVSIISGACETSRVKVTATIFDATPTDPTVKGPDNRCGIGTVTFTASGAAASGENYRWYDAATGGKLLQDEASATYSTGITTTTTFYVSIHNTVCGGESRRVPVTANITTTSSKVPPPKVTSEYNCVSKTVIFKAKKSDDASLGSREQFYWYTTATEPTPQEKTQGNLTLTGVTKTTSYYVSFYNGSCETDRVEVIAKVEQFPAPTVIDGSRCEPGTVVLTANGAVAGQEYRWYQFKSSTNFLAKSTNHNNNTFTTKSLLGNRDFFVAIGKTGSDCEGKRVKVSAIIKPAGTAPVAPKVVAIPASRCGSGTFTLEASGATGGQVYKWYDSDGTSIKKISADHTDNFFNTSSLTTGKRFYVSILDANCGNKESTLAEVQVKVGAAATPPGVTNVQRCGPGAVTLTATGGTNGEYRWYGSLKSKKILETAPTFTIADLKATTTYYVSLFNGTCETERVAIVATVQATPDAIIDGGNLACLGTPITYQAQSNGNTYTWRVSSEGAITAGGGLNDNFVTINWNTGTSGKVTLTESVGTCTNQAIKNVTLSPKPPVPVIIGDLGEVCAYESGTSYEATYAIQAPNPNYRYNWQILNGTIDGKIVFTNNDATQIRVRWNNSPPSSASGGRTTARLEVFAQAKITECRGKATTQNIMVKKTPIKPLLVDKTDSVYVNTLRTYVTTTNNKKAGHSYTWSIQGGVIRSQTENQVTVKWANQAGTRKLFVKEIVDATGCENLSDTATIYVFPYATTANAAFPVICEGGQAKLKALDNNAHKFVWYATPNGNTILGESTNNKTSADTLKLTPNTNGDIIYYATPVTLSGVNGANDSEGDNGRIPVLITVKMNNPANFTITGDVTNAQFCTPGGAGGGAVTLTSVSGGFAGAPYTYLWTKSGDASFSTTTKDLTNLNPGTYTVQVTDAGGCISNLIPYVIEDRRQFVTDAKITPSSTGSLLATAVRDTATIALGESVQLAATATDAATFVWTADTKADIANISNATEGSPTVTPQKTTKYSVLLTNNKGCDTTVSIVVRVLRFQVFVPTMFTPNNDNKNDRFQVFGNQVADLEIKVYNREGKLVYESKNKEEFLGSDEFGLKTSNTITKGWDGTLDGKLLPKGNYIWYLSGQFRNGVKIKKAGNLLLVR